MPIVEKMVYMWFLSVVLKTDTFVGNVYRLQFRDEELKR